MLALALALEGRTTHGSGAGGRHGEAGASRLGQLATVLRKAEKTDQALDRLATASFGWRSNTSSPRYGMHPLRLAEDYAMANILSHGSVVFGVGRGYHTYEVEIFGTPLLNQEANRELSEEQADIIFKAFNNKSFSHQGKHYTPPLRVPYQATNSRN